MRLSCDYVTFRAAGLPAVLDRSYASRRLSATAVSFEDVEAQSLESWNNDVLCNSPRKDDTGHEKADAPGHGLITGSLLWVGDLVSPETLEEVWLGSACARGSGRRRWVAARLVEESRAVRASCRQSV